MSKQLLASGLSAVALVASIGFAYAQSTDEGAYPNANINGTINSADRQLPAKSLDASAPSDMAKDNDAVPMQAEAQSVNDTPTTVTTTPNDATSPWAADTSAPPAATTTPAVDNSGLNSSPADSINQSNGSLSTAPAQLPTETHVDLNSPNDPIYNMGKANSSNNVDERTPRADRN